MTTVGLPYPWPVRLTRLRTLPYGRRLLPLADLVGAGVAVLLALAWSGAGSGVAASLLLLPLGTVALLALHGAYPREPRLLLVGPVTPALAATTVAGMLVMAAEHARNPDDPDSQTALAAWLLALVLIPALRTAVAGTRHLVRVRGAVAAPTLIVGAGAVAERVAHRLLAAPQHGLRPIGFLDDDAPSASRPLPVVGGLADLEKIVTAGGVRHVVIAFANARDSELVPLVRTCGRLRVGVSMVPRLFDSVNQRSAYEPLGGLPLLTLRVTDPKGWEFAVKHAFDRVMAAGALILLAPLGAVVALAVKLSSPGPVLFSQVRVGRDGQVFRMFKFRTMRIASATARFTPPPGCGPGGVEGEDRRTAVGRLLRRTALDELPQLVNVLLGQMSLVGPRPERPEFVDYFAVSLNRYGERHRVRSGLTGLAQVRGLRGQSSIGDRVELDNFYIEHWSFGLDLKLLLLTVLAVVRSEE